jgi:hypothetical protein
MSIGTGFDAAPVLVDVHYTARQGIGIYFGGGGTPQPRHDSGSFSLDFNARGTLRKTESAGYVGIAVTRLPRVAWGLGFGRHSSGYEIDQGGWFTAEELARLDTTRTRQGPHGWVAYYPGRVLGFQFQAGPGWAGASLALRFR